MNYMIKRWTELNEFMHTPGVPFSNAECERTIKKLITHRKYSLFYKTAKGAQVGDVIQSLIATCQELGVSPCKYLAWLQGISPRLNSRRKPICLGAIQHKFFLLFFY
ncbi:Transposase IS66 family protein [Pseudobacteriovorax antillogorgiicola]|uniref:Transposase IS66 family protein n=1 Tax=Pseudobacteriovorax antillogorgiicola TaxID=1513793 RepID=A0A1Y6CSF9_9BACT|nr:transposase IS66 family protein [Pseudobacteriovorax antillogorgiicola]SMF75823.1 Transposase IS66 family protein [Pseudobacteriovorax antillogorgiicola]